MSEDNWIVDSTDRIAAGLDLELPEPSGRGAVKSASEICHEAWDFFGVESGDPPDLRPLGVSLVDKNIGGVAPNQLTILAASPGVGKSTFALQCAYNAAKKIPTGIISLEDGAELLGARLYSVASGVDDKRIRQQQLTCEEIDRLRIADKKISALELYLVDANIATTDTLVQDLVTLAEQGCKVVWVDYVQRITVGTAQSERMAIKYILAQLQQVARGYGVTLVLISQLGRSYKPEFGPPQIYHLEGCSGLEQQARLILGLYPKDDDLLGLVVVKSTVGGEGVEENYVREGSRFRRL